MYRSSSLHRVGAARTRKTAHLSSFFSKVCHFSFLVWFGPLLFFCQTLLFVYHGQYHFLPLLFSLLFCLLFGLATRVSEYWLDRFEAIFRARFNRMLSIFLLFFILVVGYSLLGTTFFSSPMTVVLSRGGFTADSINLFTERASNCALILALISWLRRVPPLLRKTEKQPFLSLRLTSG